MTVDDVEPRATRPALELAGGALLGAASVALVQLFVPVGLAQPLVALLVAIACCGAAWAAERRRGARVGEAALAAGLVAAASVAFYALTLPLLALGAAALAVAVSLARRGTTPLVLLATGVVFVGARQATRVDLLAGTTRGAQALFLLLLAGHAALLARDRAARWGGLALAAQAALLVVAAFPLLDRLGVTDPGVAALALGALLGALFGAALLLDARPMLATTGALLASAALVFAFHALGPALAAMVLLLMGAALLWHAEAIGGYLGARRSGAPR